MTTEKNTTELGFSGMIEHASTDVQVQVRTLSVPRPATFYFEPGQAKRDVDKGNQHNQITHGVHQVDPNRRVSCNPIMPNIQLLRDTGNPFPTSYSEDVATTTPAWQPYVKAAHVLWKALSTAKQPMTGNDLLAIVAKRCKFDLTNKRVASKTSRAVRDTLRDLRLFGLAASDKPTSDMRSVQFAIVTDADQVKLASEA